MMHSLFALLVPVLSLALSASASSRARLVHRGLAKRVQGAANANRRFDGTRWTFFDVGLGACGKMNVASEFVVALNAAQFGSGADCFKGITMSFGGKTATATIVDECPGCSFGGLDLSRGLFNFFANEDLGVVTGSWAFVGATAAPPANPFAVPENPPVNASPSDHGNGATGADTASTNSTEPPIQVTLNLGNNDTSSASILVTESNRPIRHLKSSSSRTVKTDSSSSTHQHRSTSASTTAEASERTDSQIMDLTANSNYIPEPSAETDPPKDHLYMGSCLVAKNVDAIHNAFRSFGGLIMAGALVAG